MRKYKLILGAAMLILVLAVGTAAQAGSVYISDSFAGGVGNSVIYSVTLDSVNKRANLSTLVTMNYDGVDAISLTPNDDKIYFVDNPTNTFGYYDISLNTVSAVGTLNAGGTTITDVVQAAFSPGGTLYMTTEYNGIGGGPKNNVYTANLSNAQATLVGPLSGVNTQGNDLAFDSNGNLYLRSNANTNKWQLYTLTLPATIPNPVAATLIGNTFSSNGQGMVFDQDGTGNLLVAQSRATNLQILDKSNGSLLDTYTFYLSGSPYTMGPGDMAATLAPIPTSIFLLGSGLTLLLLGWRKKNA